MLRKFRGVPALREDRILIAVFSYAEMLAAADKERIAESAERCTAAHAVLSQDEMLDAAGLEGKMGGTE